jgi:SAM-dependent methyltransferase
VSFEVPAESYDAFMGRYSRHLSPQLADLAGVAAGQDVLDVGCGPGALTAELVSRVGSDHVTAVDPSERFVDAIRDRFPGVAVERATAEELPLPNHSVDAALAQLVVHFMTDPVAGLLEMARVTKPGGAVAACVWDHAEGGSGPMSVYYEALHEVDPSRPNESGRPGTRPGQLAELFRETGLDDIEETTLVARVNHPSFEDWWAPYELGVGPAGAYVASLEAPRRRELREFCRPRMPQAPFTITGKAWAARGSAR